MDSQKLIEISTATANLADAAKKFRTTTLMVMLTMALPVPKETLREAMGKCDVAMKEPGEALKAVGAE